ncbi:Folate-Biopterin Transporter (FBT) Family [Achlya hypogyna]|uniref:Folate-Biopterin Transporter (FBT) Family n=1 Tax=Achlya hypogyna TaxID=1202772 RepID=A0A1V9YAP5_ACHHY|nr:Folate-Biopterin Transporter (FBT) Family [Achlya hypogyna]
MVQTLAQKDGLVAGERLSYVHSVDRATSDYVAAKTPDDVEAGEFEDGALREGGALVYTSPEILAFLFQYVVVGVVLGGTGAIGYPFLTAYYQLPPNVLTSADTLMSLGWSFKVFFGMFTDCVPILGFRRKPYILGGWAVTAVLLVYVALRPAGAGAPDPEATHNGSSLALICTVVCFAFIIADVAQDALTLAYSQREPEAVRGRLISLVYAVRNFSNTIISLISGFCLNSKRFGGSFDWDIGLNAFFWILTVPVVINVPVVYFFLKDERTKRVVFRNYAKELWELLQLRVVWQVLVFNFLFNTFTGIGSTAGGYVKLHWAKVYNLNSTVMHALGNFIYIAMLVTMGKYGTGWNWRFVIVVTTIVMNVIDAGVMFLTIFDVVRNQWFYLGVPIAEKIPMAMNSMVSMFVVAELATIGNEGVMYGLVTTIMNLPGIFTSMITNVVNVPFHISSKRIKADTPDIRSDVAWTYAIAYATTAVGCLFIFLLPNQKAAVAELKKTGGSYPRVAAFLFFAFITILSVSVTGAFTSMYDETSCTILAGGQGCENGESQLYLLGIFVPSALSIVAIFAVKFPRPSMAKSLGHNDLQDLGERLSFVKSVDPLDKPSPVPLDYAGTKTPDDLEAGNEGALRQGGALVYTSPEILAFLFQYAMMGIVIGGTNAIGYPFLTAYYQLPPNVLNSAGTLMSLGWSFKVFFGMLTDCVPIFGFRRKPYILGGWLVTAVLLTYIALRPSGAGAPDPEATHNGSSLALVCTVVCFAVIIADVAQDALTVSYSQREPEAVRGRLISLVYAVRGFAGAIVSNISGFCLNSKRFGGSYDWDIGLNTFFWILTVPVVINVPIVYFFLKDDKTERVVFGNYIKELWKLLQLRAVWQVLIFNFVYNTLTGIGSTAGSYVMLYWAHVENLNNTVMHTVGTVIYIAMLVSMGKIGTSWNWRTVTLWTTLFTNAVDAVVVFLTIFDVVRDQWFYLGVPIAEKIPNAMNSMVGMFVIAELAGVGNEGVMYGLVTTVMNLPGMFTSIITNVANVPFNITTARIKADTPDIRTDVAWTYVIGYTTTIVGCFFIVLLPAQKDAVAELKKNGGSYPRVAAFLFFAFITILSVSITGMMMSMYDATSCTILAGGQGCEEAPPAWYLLGIFIPAALALLGIGVVKFYTK